MKKWVVSVGLAVVFGALSFAATTADAQLVSIPKNATVLEAKLTIYRLTNTDGAAVSVHRIVVPWTESAVTWSNFYGSDPNSPIAALDPTPITSFVPVAGLNTVETAGLKALVQGWVNGTTLNYGLALRKSTSDTTDFWSSEVESFRPALTIKYYTDNPANPTVVVIKRGVAGEVQDSYVRKDRPTTNYGTHTLLRCNSVGASGLIQKDILIGFPFGVVGCTHTQGYWKTHSLEGPAPYDPTWKRVGSRQEDTPFFRSGKTYYNALWTPPKGNAYWILAHQYIAAELNRLSGASLSAVATEFNRAAILLQSYGPSYNFKKNRLIRMQFIMLADTLDQYNNGLIGPGHCPD